MIHQSHKKMLNALLGMVLCLLLSACGGDVMNKSEPVVIKTFGDGRWFPGVSTDLDKMVSGYIDNARIEAKLDAGIVGAVAPHAGFIYSGGVAGHTFRAIKDSAAKFGAPETVIILGFTHRMGFKGVALMDGDEIQSPLGSVPLDRVACKLMCEGSDLIKMDNRPHAGEHSAENELPFVQKALPNAKVVMALSGDHESKTIEELVSALQKVAQQKKILVVASTDLLHDPNYAKVSRTDAKTLESIAKLDEQELLKGWSYDNQLCCGLVPVLAVMRFSKLQGCKNGHVLKYRNSGDDFPESRGSWVVGYGSVVFAPSK